MYSLNFALKLAWRFSKLLLIYLDHTMMHDACTAAILAQEGWEEMFQSHMTRLAQIFLPSDFCCTCYFIQRSNGSSSVWHSHWTQQNGVQEKSTGIIQVSTSDVEFTLETKFIAFFSSGFNYRCGEWRASLLRQGSFDCLFLRIRCCQG